MNNPNIISKTDKTYYSRVRNWPSYFDIKPNSKVLDIGCGQGNLGLYLKQEYSCHLTGIDIIEENARLAQKVLDRVIVGDIETLDMDVLDGQYDYIIFSDCLEHLLDPEKVLLRVNTLLNRDNGELLISIPNVRNFRVTIPLLLYGDWLYTDEGLLDRTHLRFFTLKSIIRLLEQSGFLVKKARYDLPLSSKSGLFNRLTFGLFRNHLTSHYFIQSCPKK